MAYIAPNTHAHLEAFYGVPQVGGVLVPLNYRLLPADWAYMVNHSGSRVLCVHVMGDGSHPRPEGTYLAACVFYATLYGKSPVGLPAEGIPAARAKELQALAWKAARR